MPQPCGHIQYQPLVFFFFIVPRPRCNIGFCCCFLFVCLFVLPILNILKPQLEVGQLHFFEQLIVFTLPITSFRGLSTSRSLCTSLNYTRDSSQTSRDSLYAPEPKNLLQRASLQIAEETELNPHCFSHLHCPLQLKLAITLVTGATSCVWPFLEPFIWSCNKELCLSSP